MKLELIIYSSNVTIKIVTLTIIPYLIPEACFRWVTSLIQFSNSCAQILEDQLLHLSRSYPAWVFLGSRGQLFWQAHHKSSPVPSLCATCGPFAQSDLLLLPDLSLILFIPYTKAAHATCTQVLLVGHLCFRYFTEVCPKILVIWDVSLRLIPNW